MNRGKRWWRERESERESEREEREKDIVDMAEYRVDWSTRLLIDIIYLL